MHRFPTPVWAFRTRICEERWSVSHRRETRRVETYFGSSREFLTESLHDLHGGDTSER
jgi:hypothetical protein